MKFIVDTEKGTVETLTPTEHLISEVADLHYTATETCDSYNFKPRMKWRQYAISWTGPKEPC